MAEVQVPLVLLGGGLGGPGGLSIEKELLQVDVVPTLAFLTGSSIPQGSMGKIIPSVLDNLQMNRQEYLSILDHQATHLSTTITSSEGEDVLGMARVLYSDMEGEGDRAKDTYWKAVNILQA